MAVPLEVKHAIIIREALKDERASEPRRFVFPGSSRLSLGKNS